MTGGKIFMSHFPLSGRFLLSTFRAVLFFPDETLYQIVKASVYKVRRGISTNPLPIIIILFFLIINHHEKPLRRISEKENL